MTLRKVLPFLFALLSLAGCGGGQKASGTFATSFPGRDPRLLWDSKGRLSMVYVENRPGDKAAIVYRRLGKDPTGPVQISPPGLAVAAGRETPPTLSLLPDGTLITGYPVSLPGKWYSELLTQRSTDGGKTWSAPRPLHASEDGAHSFLSSATSTSGTTVFAWLDKTSGQMGLRFASTRDGATFTPPATLDAKTCQCCGTGMTAGKAGRLWLVYRDLEADNLRDFRVLRAISDPPAFQEGVKLSEDGWHLNGCPETGARLIEAPDGTLWAAWFSGGGEPGVYVTSSPDGNHFVPRTRLTPSGKLGRHPEIGVLPDGKIAVLYESLADESRSLQAVISKGQGVWEEPRIVAEGGAYPRLATRDGYTALAFTCPGEEPRVVVADWQELVSGKDVPKCVNKPGEP